MGFRVYGLGFKVEAFVVTSLFCRRTFEPLKDSSSAQFTCVVGEGGELILALTPRVEQNTKS